jgi:hypothetical protein
MNLRYWIAGIVREQGKLLEGQTGRTDFGDRVDIRIDLAAFTDNGHDALLRQKELFGEYLQGTVKADALRLRPIIVTAAQGFISFSDQLFVSSFGHKSMYLIQKYSFIPYFTAALAFKFVWNRRFLSLFKPITPKNNRRDSFLFRRLLIIIRLFRRFQLLQSFQVVNHRLEKLKASLTLPFFGSASQSWDLFLDNFRRSFGIFGALCHTGNQS